MFYNLRVRPYVDNRDSKLFLMGQILTVETGNCFGHAEIRGKKMSPTEHTLTVQVGYCHGLAIY